MNAKQLQSEVERYRLKLRSKPAKLVSYGPSGPIDIEVIDTIVEAISSMEKRIIALEKTCLPG
jgi:hypothetical protein